jgi:hypothetical protein
MAGMLTNDPLFEPVMNSENPEALVSMLAELGYPVATAGRPLDGGGESDCVGMEEEVPMLMAMASGTEWGMTQIVTDEVTSQLATDGVLAFIPGCAPTGPTCPATITWALGAIVPQTPCTYAYINLNITTVVGGFIATCNYEARKPFIQTRTGAGVRSNCTTYTCRQIRIGWAAAPVSCTYAIPNATGFGCPPQPACVGPASSNAICSPTAVPTFWNPWGPPCP